MRRLLLPSLIVLAFLAFAAPAAANLPARMIGMSPQGTMYASDYELMRESGVRSVRLPLSWASVQPGNRAVSGPDFSSFDQAVALAAEERIRIFPFVWGSPPWAAGEADVLPVATAWQRWGWCRFLRDAVERYGPEGSFWEENPQLPFLPIRNWEIWNEENIVSFTKDPNPVAYAKLLRISGRVLHRADPGSNVIVGGMLGRVLQSPPNVQSGVFLSRLYRTRGVKRYFDGVALHPYVARAMAMRGEFANLRRVMRVHHDSSTPIYVTELGWGSSNGPTRWQRGIYGQAEELDRAFSLLSAHRRSWRLRGVWWFSWTDDTHHSCKFCDSAGLLTANHEAKPAWYAFNAWTGGDAFTVPRASLGG